MVLTANGCLYASPKIWAPTGSRVIRLPASKIFTTSHSLQLSQSTTKAIFLTLPAEAQGQSGLIGPLIQTDNGFFLARLTLPVFPHSKPSAIPIPVVSNARSTTFCHASTLRYIH